MFHHHHHHHHQLWYQFSQSKTIDETPLQHPLRHPNHRLCRPILLYYTIGDIELQNNPKHEYNNNNNNSGGGDPLSNSRHDNINTTTTTIDNVSTNFPPPNVGVAGLETGISGMTLNPGSGNRGSATPPPTTTGLASSGDSVHSHHSAASGLFGTSGGGGGGNSSVAGSVGSAPATMSRPPGLAINVNIPPSHVISTTTTAGHHHHHHGHINKPSHTKNSASTSSSTAHTATLTPTSSLDGGASSDLYGGLNTSRQSVVHSPVNSTLSGGAADHLPGIAGLGGSFDAADDDRSHDGLLGLQALRDRAHSSPGPVLSSSPIASNNNSYSTSPRTLGNVVGVPPTRPRTVSKDSGRGLSTGSSRPPLAGGSALSPTSLGSGIVGTELGGGLPAVPISRSRDASPPPGAGVISRPADQPYSPYTESGGAGSGTDRVFDSSLRRALSDAGTEYNRNSFSGGGGGSNNGTADGFINDNKFSSSPFTSPHQQNRGVSGAAGGPSLPPSLQGGPGLYHNRHHRSQSQPGPRAPNADYYGNIPAYGDSQGNGSGRRGSDYGSGEYDDYGGGYGNHGGGSGSTYPRSMSMQHTGNSYSDPNFHDGHHRRGSTGYYGGRRDDHGGRKYDQQYDRSGNGNYPRQDRFISPAHSPHHASYGGHSRQSSDMGSSALTSSPMSLSSMPLYNRRRDGASGEEDLSHPLAGENIEVPTEDQYFAESHGHTQHPRAHSMGHVPSYHGESRPLPTAGASMPPFRAVYNVKFKRTQRPFEIGPRLTRDLKVGTYVKVEADRGEDLGIVIGYVGRSTGPPHRPSWVGVVGGMGGDMPTGGNAQMPHDRKKIIRLATHDEVGLLQMKRDEEDELLRVCRMKVRQRGLPMNVVDAEYQFDRHKLTFFFEAECRVDFRDLVRDLFSIYKTRIWMQQLDKNIAASCPAAPEPESLMMDYGTPIMAPAHEYEDFASTNASAPPNAEEFNNHPDQQM